MSKQNENVSESLTEIIKAYYGYMVDEDNHALCDSCETMFKPTIILKTKDCPNCGELNSLIY